MERPIGNILKSNEVNLEGRFRLNAGQGALNPANKKNAILSPAQACIVENDSEFAVLEVICGCGEKIHIKCEYTKQGTDQKNIGENENES